MKILSIRLKKPIYPYQSKEVTPQNISGFDNNPNIEVIVCSREVAKKCEELSFPNLKLIQLTSAGYDGLDLEKFRTRNIAVCNAANVYNVGMAEFVIYAMLTAAKRYNKGIKNRRIRLFRNYCHLSELAGKTVGVMGVGNIGKEVAKRARAFDMKVIGYARKTFHEENFEQIFHFDNFFEFISQCDYLVNTLPHNEQTIGLLNREVFQQMKETISIINVGRKSIFNDADFLSFLKRSPNATAILDMFEKFPNPITNPYRRLENVLVLPGVTAISQEINEKLHDLILRNIASVANNHPLINRIC